MNEKDQRELNRKIKAEIDKFGWQVTGVEAHSSPATLLPETGIGCTAAPEIVIWINF